MNLGTKNGNKKRAEIMKYVFRYKTEHDGNSPTLRDIMAACEMSSLSVVEFHIRKLITNGELKLMDGKLTVPGGKWYPPY